MSSVLTIGLLLPYSLGSDLGGIADPQLHLQLGQQSFKPPRLPARFHPQPYLHSSDGKLAIKLLRLLPMLQSSLLELASLAVHKSNLLNSRVIIATYNDHLRLLSPGPWLVSTTKAYSGVGADIVMESIWRFFSNNPHDAITQLVPFQSKGCHFPFFLRKT